MTNQEMPEKVAAVFAGFPAESRAMALALRDLILATAHDIDCNARVSESLKWGQPSFVIAKGTPLRIGVPKRGGCALYAHCQTTVVGNYAETFPGADVIDGNRGVIFRKATDIVPDRLTLLIRHALTYHA